MTERLAPAHKMYDLDAIALAELVFCVQSARYDLAIDLNGHGASQVQVLDESAKGQGFGDGTCFTIKNNIHRACLAPWNVAHQASRLERVASSGLPLLRAYVISQTHEVELPELEATKV